MEESEVIVAATDHWEVRCRDQGTVFDPARVAQSACEKRNFPKMEFLPRFPEMDEVRFIPLL